MVKNRDGKIAIQYKYKWWPLWYFFEGYNAPGCPYVLKFDSIDKAREWFFDKLRHESTPAWIHAGDLP